MYSLPQRPAVSSESIRSRTGSAAWRGSGPSVPAFRYALLSRTGNWARNSAGSGIRAILVAVDELTLEHLVGPVARQLVEEHDLARDLVAGQVLADVVTDLVAGELGAAPEHHERPQPLT